MRNESNWYFGLAARTLKIEVDTVKAYCKEHNYLPTTFYELVNNGKIVSKNKKIYVNRR